MPIRLRKSQIPHACRSVLCLICLRKVWGKTLGRQDLYVKTTAKDSKGNVKLHGKERIEPRSSQVDHRQVRRGYEE